MMEFLYFPEDKTEYIPGIITLIIFMIGAAVTMYLVYKKSKKEERIFNEQYSEYINNDSENKNDNSIPPE